MEAFFRSQIFCMRQLWLFKIAEFYFFSIYFYFSSPFSA